MKYIFPSILKTLFDAFLQLSSRCLFISLSCLAGLFGQGYANASLSDQTLPPFFNLSLKLKFDTPIVAKLSQMQNVFRFTNTDIEGAYCISKPNPEQLRLLFALTILPCLSMLFCCVVVLFIALWFQQIM